MASTTKLGLPQLSITDAHHIGVVIAEAAAGLEHCANVLHGLLSQRDLVALWDDDQGAFRPEFEPLAERYHALQRALLELSGESFGWHHDLSTYVEAQR